MDADHFKRINDTVGHQGGDSVIKEIASRIKNNIKSRDIVARIGGEEFVVITSASNKSDSAKLAERIRAAIENEPVRLEGATSVVAVSASIGLCWAPYQSLNGEIPTITSLLIAKADAALYLAKSSGRNCVRAVDLSEHSSD